MFTIFTESPSERNILEQDFATLNDRFHIRLHESPAIAGILRSISYELFRSSPSELAQDVTRLAVESLQLKLSLSLFRGLMEKIKRMEELVTLLQDYFIQLSKIVDPLFGLQQRQPFSKAEEASAIQNLQHLQQTSSEHRLITDFQEELQKAIGGPQNYQSFVKTRRTGIPEMLEQGTARERLQLIDGMFQSQDSSPAWWKQHQREQLRNSSRELSQFQSHRPPLLQVNISINSLLQEQAQFQQQREEQLHLKRRSEQSLFLKFTRNMRVKLLRAKLKRRRK